MKELETDFLEEYKVVDRICGDEYLSQNGMSEYILQMEEAWEAGRDLVPSWDDHYHVLKRLRRVRNQIVHDPYGSECAEQDLDDLKAFHKDLINVEDPLALLRKKRRRSGRDKETFRDEEMYVEKYDDAAAGGEEGGSGLSFYVICGILIAAFIVFAFYLRIRLLS